MGVQNRSWGRGLTMAPPVTTTAERPAVVRRGSVVEVLSPISLSLALGIGTLLFIVASYPLWPRMYLSPVLDLYPPLADMFLRLFSTDLAHQAVAETGGNVFFYLYTLASLALYGVYGAALLFARGRRAKPRHLRWIIATTAFVGMLLLFSPTLFTSDLYSYVIYGRIAAAYGGNPLVTPPNMFPVDPVYPQVFWKDTVSVYGPVWIDLSYVLMAFVPPVVSSQIAAFKITAILFHIANAVIVWRILRRLSPRFQLFGTLAYAWNPLLLVEFGANGHNDVVMIFFVLLSVLSIVRGRRVWPLIFLSAAILTKWIAVFLVPIYLLATLREQPNWRQRGLFLLRGGLATGAFVAFAYLPYWAGPQTVTAMFDSAAVERFINSFPELMVGPFTKMLRGSLTPPTGALTMTEQIAGYVLKAVFGVIFLSFWARQLLRARFAMRLAGPWLSTLFAYLVIACTWFWPWYISWLVPLAALNGRSRVSQATLLFTFSGLFFYSLWPGAPLRPFEPYYDARAAALFGLPLLYLLATAVVDRWRDMVKVRSEV